MYQFPIITVTASLLFLNKAALLVRSPFLAIISLSTLWMNEYSIYRLF